MKKISTVFVCFSLLTICGCKDVKREKSAVLHEEAKVITAIYTPSRHETNLSPSLTNSDSIVGMGFDGSVGIKVGGLVISSNEVPENFGVLFQCQHGSFTSQGSDPRHKALYEKFKNWEGKKVDVTYQEIYRVTYDDKDKDGKKEEVERVLVDFDFLDADKIEG